MIATLLLMVAGLQTTGAQNFIKVWSGTRYNSFVLRLTYIYRRRRWNLKKARLIS